VTEVWIPTAVGNDFPLPLSEEASAQATDGPAPLAETTDEPPAADPPTNQRPRRSPQKSGAALEQATIDLLARLFTMEADTRERLLLRLRRQGAGTQFGHDIELDCTVAGSPTVRCHVECKNLDHEIALNDIAAKLAQQKFYHRDAQVDHWILISPHGNPNNEVRTMLNTWEEASEYPFSVQIWSPENGVRELFAAEPAVYEAIYGGLPTDRELTSADGALAMIQDRLAPRLRIGDVWRRYLMEPWTLCFANEDARHFEELYANHLHLRATDARGSLLEGNLMDQVEAWIYGETQPSLLLLGFR
jgi:hypothetical protein